MVMGRLTAFCTFARAATAAALCTASLARVASAQDASSAVPQVEGADEVVVTGRSLRDLRREIEAAELAVFDRFNEINGDDRFDIHCFQEVRYFSHIRERVCRSNGWREQEANYTEAWLQELRGESAPSPEMFRGEQARLNRLLEAEMRRLAAEDPELMAAVARLNRAHAAFGRSLAARSPETLSFEVPPTGEGLPYDARRAVIVRIGREPWRHALEQRTFTMAQVDGEVRGLELQCGAERKRLEYRPDVEWSVPQGARDCTLAVTAKRDTKFVLYEFD